MQARRALLRTDPAAAAAAFNGCYGSESSIAPSGWAFSPSCRFSCVTRAHPCRQAAWRSPWSSSAVPPASSPAAGWANASAHCARCSSPRAPPRPVFWPYLLLPLAPAISLLPLLGVMLNGTSSVLYGTVPELKPPDHTERAFALFYTGTIGSGATAPVLYGLIGDALGANLATIATAATALAICPLALALAPHLSGDAAGNSRG